jgi:hypothetical protein
LNGQKAYDICWFKKLSSPRCEPLASVDSLEEAITKLNTPSEHFAFKKREYQGLTMPDRQRKAVYEWEDRIFVDDDDIVPDFALKKIFDDVVEHFELPEDECRLIFPNKGTQSLQRGYSISIIANHMKPSIMVHELAHVIIFDAFLNSDMDALEGHGPEWLTTYMILLIEFLDYEASSLIATAKLYGLRFFESTILKRHGRNRTSVDILMKT